MLTDLRSSDPVTRDAATARLTVIGARAVDRLLALSAETAAPSAARAAALRAIEGIADPRTLSAALEMLRAPDDDVGVAAVGVARGFLQSANHVEALDALTATVLDRQRSESVRVAALRALEALDAATLRPIREALLTDGSSRLRSFAQGVSVDATDAAKPGDGWLDRPPPLVMPDDPDAVRREVERRGSAASLPLLHRALEIIRERELAASARARREWRAARTAVHAVLAHRGSRVGLYDLRELLQTADGPVAAPLLVAVGLIGDASCLETLAELSARATPAPAGDTWRRQIVEAFRAIVAREGITLRHAVAKKTRARWPSEWPALYGTADKSAKRF